MRSLFNPAVVVMNRLTYPQKFLLISLLFTLPLGVALTQFIREIDSKINFAQEEFYGNAYLRPLRQLLEHSLESQLLAHDYLSGDASAQSALLAVQAQIDSDFTTLAAVEKELGVTLETPAQFNQLNEGWQSLKSQMLNLDVDTSDARHTQFIADVRGLISHVGNTSNLILDPDLDSYYLMDSVLLKLPEGQDLLAQTRLLGERILAQQSLSVDEKIQLIVLGGLVKANNDATHNGLNVAFQNNPAQNLEPVLAGPSRDSAAATGAFLNTLNQEIINAEALSLEREAYRAAAGEALAASFDLWDQTVDQLDGLLQARIAGFARRRAMVVAVTAVGLVLVAYLWVGFYRAVMRTVSGLAEASRRMVSGDMTGKVVLDNRDELGQVVTSFNDIAKRLRAEWSQAREESARAAEAEAMLRESETRTRLILDTALDAVITMDAEGRLTGWNPQAESIFGWRRQEIIGKQLSATIIPPEYRKAHDNGLRHFLATGAGPLLHQRIEIIALHQAGHTFPVELAIVPVRTGDTHTFSAFVRDITARRRAEVELRQAKEAAETANLAKSEFLANMSHEIRTPMNAVIGMTGLLLDTKLTSEQKDFARTIRDSGDALLTIINDILDFSKIEAGKLELETDPFDLRDCIETSLDLMAARASEKGLELAYLIDTHTPGSFLGDATRLRQILVNLIGNAVKFTEHGEVVVSVQSKALRESEAGPRTADPGPQTSDLYELHFAIKDTGLGIPADRMGRLFQSFSQVDASTTRRYGGTGLGLAISKRLCEMMHGRMWVESEGIPGRGSTFHFTIMAQPSSSPAHVYLHGAQPQLSGKHLLIVDDNPTNRQILSLQAQSWGMQPQATASPLQALEWMRAGEAFDVAILDMQMPEMDGVALALEIRNLPQAQALPLVMLTSIGRREVDSQAADFAAFLTKPIKPSQLYNVLAGIFAPEQAVELRQAWRPRKGTGPLFDSQLGQRLPLRILLAEDNAVNQKLALRLLERMGYRADVAANGLEVLEALQRQPYDVVLMDMQMPEMDGLEATRRIRQPTEDNGGQQPRIIAMTANAMQGDREACLAAGMDDYVSKPVQVKELQAALERSGQQMAQTPEPTPTAPAQEELAPVDWGVLDRLREGQGPGESDFVKELIGMYFQEALPLLAALREAVIANDAAKVRHAAHTLKGTSASLGAQVLVAHSAELEKKGRSGSLEGAEVLLAQIEAEFERVRQALDSEGRGAR